MPKRAAAYIRVSTAKQEQEGLSLQEQERRCREYISAQSWELTEVYRDVMSGTREDRPQLELLLASLDDIDAIVCLRLDRMGRNTKHTLGIYSQLEKADVGLVSITDNIDTAGPMGKAMRTIMAALHQMESETTGARQAGHRLTCRQRQAPLPMALRLRRWQASRASSVGSSAHLQGSLRWGVSAGSR